MSKLSKFFCIAVAGATVDGRTIEENWISEMAASYDPATYTANVNIEHLRGISPEPPFNCQGKVVAVEERTIELAVDGKKEKRKALFGQVEANDNLVAYNAKGQKLFPSVEVNPAFAGTKKAYLVGLATTDSPASLGTEVMTFAASQGDKSFLKGRKLEPGNFFSATLPELGFNLEFEDDKAEPTGAAAMFAAATEFFKGFGKAPEQPKEQEKQAETPPPANDNISALSASIATGFEKLTAAMTAGQQETTAAIATLRTDHDALKASIETTEAGGPKRPVATGGEKYTATDC